MLGDRQVHDHHGEAVLELTAHGAAVGGHRHQPARGRPGGCVTGPVARGRARCVAVEVGVDVGGGVRWGVGAAVLEVVRQGPGRDGELGSSARTERNQGGNRVREKTWRTRICREGHEGVL